MLSVKEMFAGRAQIAAEIAAANGRASDDEMDSLVDRLGEVEDAIVATRSTSDDEIKAKCDLLAAMAFEGDRRADLMLASIEADRGW